MGKNKAGKIDGKWRDKLPEHIAPHDWRAIDWLVEQYGISDQEATMEVMKTWSGVNEGTMRSSEIYPTQIRNSFGTTTVRRGFSG